MLYLDIPSRSDVVNLSTHRSDACISIYIGTTPQTQNITGSVIEFGNLGKEAVRQLQHIGFDKRRLALIQEQLDDLAEDEEFWTIQAHSLCVLVTPDTLRTFRLPNRLTSMVQVSDRFHLQPLIRAITFRNRAFVLALAENSVRLIEVFPDGPPAVIRVPDLPKDAASHAGKSTLNDRSHVQRIHGSEGKKVRLRQYARAIDHALRSVLSGRDEPLIVAATEPLLSIYRSVNSYAELEDGAIVQSPGEMTEAQLAEASRAVLDVRYRRKLVQFSETYQQRALQGRVTSDVAIASRAATAGAIETLLVDMDKTVTGFVQEETGEITFAADDARSYDILDDISARSLMTGATVMSVRAEDLPDPSQPLAAVLRYAF